MWFGHTRALVEDGQLKRLTPPEGPMLMPTRWTVFDQMVRELGSLRVAATSMEEDAKDMAEGFEAAKALADATTAVCRYVDDDDQQVLVDTWAAIARAQDVLRHATEVAATARQKRASAREAGAAAIEQRARAREQAVRLAEQGERVRLARPAKGDPPSE
jgi:hypothetical protein